MDRFVVAFDIDGTLRCNCTEVCRDENPRVAEALRFFQHSKNWRVILWSGGGKNYAEEWGRKYGIEPQSCYSKLAPPDFTVHLAIDDQQEFKMGEMQLIVREK